MLALLEAEQPEEDDEAPGGDPHYTPDEIDFEIKGAEMQFVEIELDPGEAAGAEAGALMYMEDGVRILGGFTTAGAAKAVAFWAFVIAFAVKVPVWPFHTWLPDAYVESPTPVTILLAGVLVEGAGMVPLGINAGLDSTDRLYDGSPLDGIPVLFKSFFEDASNISRVAR